MNVNGLTGNSESELPDYEILKYEIVDTSEEILLNNACDPDLNFFNLKTQNFDTPCILPEEFKKFHDTSCDDSFSILHLNIRSIKKNFENFKLFFSTLGYSFSVICFSETWLDDTDSNSLYELPNYISKHQIRDDRKGGGVSFYIHNSLSFRSYVNDLCSASNILDPIMFADDTNLFYSHQNISSLFMTVNNELDKIGEWFKANKLSLNVKKTKYTFFHKHSIKDDIPLKLPALKIANREIERTNAIKFLGILLDENISWKNHIRSVEKNLAKNTGLLHRAKYLLDDSSLKTIYFSYIHSYLNYANIAWGSTYRTKLKTIHYHQKHAARIVFDQDKLTHSRPLLRSLNALNVYQINLYQHLNFMHKVNNNVAPIAFHEIFTNPSHNYPTNFSYNSFSLKKCSLNSTKYSISFRGPKLWNDFLNNEEKQIRSYTVFSKKIKSKLLDAENELEFF